LPAIARHVAEDAYMSIQSMWRAGPDRTSYDLPRPIRRSDSVRWLNALFADIDHHQEEPSSEWYGRLLGQIEAAQQSGEIPPPSMFVRSGRGVWLLWLLRGRHDPAKPQAAYPSDVRRWRAVQTALLRRLSALRPDAACDAARCIRVPDSINSRAALPLQRVKYSLQPDDNGRLFLYTLADLEAAFPIAPPARMRSPALVLTGRAQLGKRNGYLARVRRLRADIERLIELRGGGSSEGCRHYGAYYLAVSLFRSLFPPDEVLARVSAFGRHCRPALSDCDCRDAVKSAAKAKRLPGRAKLYAHLRVTPAEEASLAYIKPTPWVRPVSTRSQQTEILRAAIRQAAETLGDGLSVAKLRDELAGRGLSISRNTVWRQCRAMGIRPCGANGRPRKNCSTLCL
jgi:hypothetical protein